MESRSMDRETLERRTLQAGTSEMRPETYARFDLHLDGAGTQCQCGLDPLGALAGASNLQMDPAIILMKLPPCLRISRVAAITSDGPSSK